MADDDRVVLEVQMTGDSQKGDPLPGDSPSSSQPHSSSKSDKSEKGPTVLDQLLTELEQRKSQSKSAPPPAAPPPVYDGTSPFSPDTPDSPSALGTSGKNILPSLVASATTSSTGSPVLGTAAGTGTSAFMESGSPLAGPLALGAAAAMVASEINNKLLDLTNTMVGGLSDFSTSPETPDPSSAVLSGVSAASEYADPLQKLTGINLSPVDDVLRIFIDSVQKAAENLDRLALVVQDYSGDVAGAVAEREIGEINRRIEQAAQIGPDLANFVRARTAGEDSLSELKLLFQKDLIPAITAIQRMSNSAVETAVEGKKALDSIPYAMKLLMAPGLLKIFPVIGELMKWLGAEEKERAKKEAGEYRREVDDFLRFDSLIDDDLPGVPDLGGLAPPGAPGAGVP